jgi:ABC-type nitrate/sulfonate/bicarbonate transport system permease component
MLTSSLKYLLIRIAAPVTLLILLAYGVRWMGWIRPAVFPYPHEIIAAGWEAMGTPKTYEAVAVTLKRLVYVFLISLAIGTIMSFLFQQFKILEEIFAMPVDVIRSIPVVTLFPLFITIWGFGEMTFLAVPISLTSVIMYIHITAGLKAIDPMRVNLMRRWGASRLQQILHLHLPTVAPYLFTSLRICVSLQLILLLVAEMFLGARDGLGTLIYDNQTILRYKEMYFFILLAGFIGWGINRFLEFLQRKIVFWEAAHAQ